MATASRKTALFALLATAWLAGVVVFAGVFVIAEHEHEHVDATGRPVSAGDDCVICLELQIAVRIIEAFERLGVSLAVVGFVIYSITFEKPRQAFCRLNPVALKVKFNC